MMFIKWQDKYGDDVVRTWHNGDPVPETHAYVVTFQADGDELDFLLACMEKVRYRKSTGSLVFPRP